jgi:hypothetical protein
MDGKWTTTTTTTTKEEGKKRKKKIQAIPASVEISIWLSITGPVFVQLVQLL